ncbi:MAG: glycosyltransferase [Candidatus Eremiobacteraeota bacterium]|nr:glycosyltransferase [Candidatus Eremiobacteraeota bacterium]
MSHADPDRRSPHLTIGMFTDTYAPETNGVVTSIVSTAQSLRRRGHRVIVVAPAHPEGDEEHPDLFHLRSASFPFYPEFRMAFPLPAKVVANLPAMPFDVIHAHTFFFIGCFGAYLARLRHTPLFFTYHTKFEDYLHYLPVNQRITKPQTLWLSRQFSNQCDRVIAPSQGTEGLLRSYGISAPIEVLPGGVDLERFGPTEDVPPVMRSGQGPVLLSVGRLGKEKNLEFLLDAFDMIATAAPRARLIIVGDGPYRAELERRVAASAHAGQITFTGALEQSQLGTYYRNADALVFTSLTETQGLVLVEALAHGLPVVAVDCPVTRECVLGDAGVLVPEQTEVFARAVLDLTAEAPGRHAERAAAARDAAAPYSVDALAARLERLYLHARAHIAVATR